MAGETTVTIIGNVAGEVDLRFTPSGAAVANFSVASTPRSFDKTSQEWRDGETLWMRCSVWRAQAEQAAESLVSGTRVIVTGKLKSRSYEKDGQKRTALELEVDEIGASIKWATVKVNKANRGDVSGAKPGTDADPWASAPVPAGVSDEPAPF